jgi:integrase/recombinase XerD
MRGDIMTTDVHAPSLKELVTRDTLPVRKEPYWNILEYGRHIGLRKRHPEIQYWVARTRMKSGEYKQHTVGVATTNTFPGMSFEEAVLEARTWFEALAPSEDLSEASPVGGTTHLRYISRGGVYTVGDALVDYVSWKRLAAAKTTFASNLALINHHMIDRLGDIPLDELTGRHVQRFCIGVLETPPKRGNQRLGPRRELASLEGIELRNRKATLNTLLGILRLAVQVAWENGETDSERAWRCIRRVPNSEPVRTEFLTRAECRRLLDHCRPDLRLLVQAALYTGCRAQELTHLRVADVATHVFGIYVAPSKNYRSRYVFLPDEGMAFFLRQREGRDPSAFIFSNAAGRPWAGNYRHLFKGAVREAALNDRIVFHSLRHTYASQLVQAGTPLPIVAQQLGHATTDTVSRTYGHLAPSTLEAEIRSRFAPLDPALMVEVDLRKRQLSSLSRSLQQTALEGEEDRSWPRSNFCRGRIPSVADT